MQQAPLQLLKMPSQAAVILAAGKGTRMETRLPKVLHKICGQEMVSIVAGVARTADMDSIVVLIGPDGKAVKDVVGNRVRYVVQDQPLGTGHALQQARFSLEGIDTIVVINGDSPLIRAATLTSMMRRHVDEASSITLLTSDTTHLQDFGRVLRDESGKVSGIVESGDADDAVRAISEVLGGIYLFDTSWLWSNLESLEPSQSGEVYLTDLVSRAYRQGIVVNTVQTKDWQEMIGVNTRSQLAMAETVLRDRIREHWMEAGVTIPDTDSVYIDIQAVLGQDTTVHPNTHVSGHSQIGRDCEIGPNSIVDDCRVGDRCAVVSSVIRGSTLEDDVEVGPFSHIRPGSHLESNVHIGSSAEIKNSRLGRGTKSGHFSFIGDAVVGAEVNIGAGTVTCNYDGVTKHKTRIGDGALIGSASMLIAPVTIGDRAETGAGSVVTEDVLPGELVVGVPARVRLKRDLG